MSSGSRIKSQVKGLGSHLCCSMAQWCEHVLGPGIVIYKCKEPGEIHDFHGDRGSMSWLCVYQDLERGEHVLFKDVRYYISIFGKWKKTFAYFNKWHNVIYDAILSS